MASAHHYIKSKLKSIRREYKGADAKKIISAAGCKCSLCGRKNGARALFGPTHYLKKQIIFRVGIHIHCIMWENVVYPVVICDACHLGYHLWNRLDMYANFGGMTLNSTLNRPARKTGRRVAKVH